MAEHLLSYEQGPIRPPSEASSLLLRLTRNCPWNRCLFCPVYKGEKYSRRSLEEIKHDIHAIAGAVRALRERSWQQGCGGVITREMMASIGDGDPALYPLALWLYRGSGSVFLQDGDSLVFPTADLAEILILLRQEVPGITRITTYARTRSLLRKSVDELLHLRQAGLSRIHVGLESGCDRVLDLMKKGVTGAQHVEAGQKVKAAGISLSEYVLLGLGGREMWREHARDTAEVLSQINPDFIRVRTLAIHPRSPLYRIWEQGDFNPMEDEGILREEKLLLENLRKIDSEFVSDHFLNLLEEVAGKLPGDRGRMIAIIERYFALPLPRRELFRLGRRTGMLRFLDDLNEPAVILQVERLYRRLTGQGLTVDEYTRQVLSGNL
jgi:radical SAM superfamily enzyme YgiQ (UPF0313 family)